MSRRTHPAIRLLVLAVVACGACAETITVDVARRIAPTVGRLGINLDYLADDDALRPHARSLVAALRDLGVGTLRYPGGGKSQNQVWALPPYDTAAPHIADLSVWPGSDRRIVTADGAFVHDVLAFDEFLALCGEVGVAPTVVLCFDPMYRDGSAITRQQLIDAAVGMVRFAGRHGEPRVRYWELGNETDHVHDYGGTADPQRYADDVRAFATAMKAADPAIRIAVNGKTWASDSERWWKTVLSRAGDIIDVVALHSYAGTGWGSYDRYEAQRGSLVLGLAPMRQWIASHAPAADRSRLLIAMTETGVIDWSKDNPWPNVNDLGHALVLVDLIGQLLAQPDLESLDFWTTRWIDQLADPAAPAKAFDALDYDNRLTASGRALAIWGQFLGDELVACESTDAVRAFATRQSTTDALSVILINPRGTVCEAHVALANHHGYMPASRWIFGGTSPADIKPEWRSARDLAIDQHAVDVSLPPWSVTVLAFE
jgi:alpha-L-arabinofuranosidase